MPPRQNNPAMIDLSRRSHGVAFGQARALSQRSAACRAPIDLSIHSQHSMALTADSLHIQSLSHAASPNCSAPSLRRYRAPCLSYTELMHPPVRLVAIDMDGTLLPSLGTTISRRNAQALRAAQQAGVTVVIATGRRVAYTAPLLADLGLRADTPLIASNGAVVRTLSGEFLDCCHMEAATAKGICTLFKSFGVMVFTFDLPGRGELVLEDLDRAQGRIALWVEANRNSIEVINPLESVFGHGENPIQGMVAGSIPRMREAEQALKMSQWAAECDSVRTEYPARDLSILDLLPMGISKASALKRLAERLEIHRSEAMAIGDNWNDQGMLEWAGQAVVMANASTELRTLAKLNGWKQAPKNDDDGVAVVLERALEKRAAATARAV
jgi:Cof subfamily protein (haloacid dehalogenase superfamily)